MRRRIIRPRKSFREECLFEAGSGQERKRRKQGGREDSSSQVLSLHSLSKKKTKRRETRKALDRSVLFILSVLDFLSHGWTSESKVEQEEQDEGEDNNTKESEDQV